MKWNHSCKRVAELISQSMDERLGVMDRVRMRWHLHLCGNCRNVEQQLRGMKSMAAEMFEHGCDESGEASSSKGSGKPNARTI